jgi:hypothetical protein
VSELSSRDNDFCIAVLNAIDKTFSALGETPKYAIYQHLKLAQNISKQEIPNRIDEFSFTLDELFGIGSKFLEIDIIKNIHEEVGVVWEKEKSHTFDFQNLKLSQFMNFLRKHFEEIPQNDRESNNLKSEKDR